MKVLLEYLQIQFEAGERIFAGKFVGKTLYNFNTIISPVNRYLLIFGIYKLC